MLAERRTPAREPIGPTIRSPAIPLHGTPRELRAPRPLRRPPPLVGRRGVGGRPPGRPAARAAGAAALSAGGFILDDLESARARAGPPGRARRAAVGVRARLHLRHARGRHARVRGCRGRRGHGGRRRRARTSPGSLSHVARAAPGHGRRPHGLRHRVPRPPARRLAGRHAGRAASASARRRGSTSRSPAAPRSTATSRPSPSPTSGGASSISLPLAALALLVVFGSCRGGGRAARGRRRGGARRAGARSSSSRRSCPMSIFVLNLATLLGLGLGVDYSLLMTSRFREELGEASDGRRRGRASREAVRGDGRDRRPGGVLLGPHGPARPARPDPVRVHDPALGRASPGRSSWASRSSRR